MDSDSTSSAERIHSNMMYSDGARTANGRKSVLFNYGLISVSYILIMVLFIIVLSKSSKSESLQLGTNSGLNDYKNNVTSSRTEAQSTDLALAFEKLKNEVTSSRTEAQSTDFALAFEKLKNEVDVINQRTEEQSLNITMDIEKLKEQVAELTSKLSDQKTTRNNESCETGWLDFDGSCYYISTIMTNWMKGREMCKMKESDLVVINSKREQNAIYDVIKDYQYRRYWIGLTDVNSEGVWEWIDGTDYLSTVKFWAEGEPNDAGSNEDCVHLWKGMEWNDVHCTFDQCYAICEKKKTVN